VVKSQLVAVVYLRRHERDFLLLGQVAEHVKCLVDGLENAEELFVKFKRICVQLRKVQKVLH
jgi:hypothetical protein